MEINYPRAHPCVFLGYSSSHKGYNLINLSSNKVFVSREVRFHENIFPFSSLKPDTPLFSPPIFQCFDDSFPLVMTPPPSATTPSVSLRHSARSSRPHVWTKDFVCPSFPHSSSVPHLISNFIFLLSSFTCLPSLSFFDILYL